MRAKEKGAAQRRPKDQHGEKYAQAVSPEQAKAWKDYAYVCRSVQKSIRIDILPFSKQLKYINADDDGAPIRVKLIFKITLRSFWPWEHDTP